ncbi:MAG TPA: isoprenylcysteine carboxylmethyltransferase family protein [Allosphingosinicella sp.]|nr:isoprenylcysteine carboxylmethyltransferase family protein [Allosphingosinicella sp.]
MARIIYLLFGALAYLIFFATFLYLIAFVGDLAVVPRTVDRGGADLGAGAAAGIDLALVALFGLQHSVMARQGFKRAWSRLVPKPIERSAYVLFASLALILMFAFWAPIAGDLWTVENSVGRTVLWALFALGWLIVLLSTFLISHFELFGLAQVWNNLQGKAAAAPVFRQPFFYRFVRHPLYSGFFLAFWSTPRMSWGHLLLAAAMSIYMLIAIRFEERDLVDLFGADYEAYRARVGMLSPRVRRRP